MRIQQLILNAIFFSLVILVFTLDAFEGLSILSFVTAFLYLLLYFVFSRRIIFSKDLIIPISFCLFNFASLLWGGDIFSTINVTSAILIGCVVSLGLRTIINLPVVLWGIAISAVINIAFSYQSIKFLQRTNEIRVGGLLGNPNGLAIFLSLSAFLIYFLSSKRTVLIKGFVFFLLFFVIFYTGSRKGLLLVGLISLIIYFEYLLRRKSKIRSFRILTIITISVILLGIFSQKFGSYLKDTTTIQRAETLARGEDKWSAPIRHLMINRGVELWYEKPIFGWGGGGFTINSGFFTYAHNNYVELLADYGLIGFFLYYAYYIYLFVCGWRLRKKYLPRVGMAIVGMFFILELGLVSLGSKTSWIFIGVAAYCIFLPPKRLILKDHL